MTQVGHQIQVSVYLAVPASVVGSGLPLISYPASSAGEMVLAGKFLVNALKYGYCIPLFTALLLATPGLWWRKMKIWFMGMLILQLAQAWGVSFEVLKILLFDQGPEVPGMLGYGFLSLNGVGLAYQFGFLILPAVAPVVIWMAFHTDYLPGLAPGLVRTLKSVGRWRGPGRRASEGPATVRAMGLFVIPACARPPAAAGH